MGDETDAGVEAEKKEVQDQFDNLERAVMAELDNSGTTLSRGIAASASVSEEELPNVKDWDAFYKYIQDNEAFFLLQRRVSSAAYRELKYSGTEVPGVETFKKRRLNLRKVSK